MPVPGKTESGLEAYRRTIAPPVIDGERYLARRQASYDDGNAMFARWKPGYLLLTPTRLLFYQGESQLFEVALADVRSVEVLMRRWLTRKSCEQLVVTYQTRRALRSVCLRTEDLEEWRESIRKNLPGKIKTETTLATPWAAYEAWRVFGSPRSLKRRKPFQTSNQESEIL